MIEQEHEGRYHRVPDFLNTELDSCKKLTHVMRAVDPGLFCAWNRLTQRYEVWGRSKERGFCKLDILERDGQPYSPELHPYHILADLRARDKDPNMRALLERNAAEAEKRWVEWMGQAGEGARYMGAAVAQLATDAPLRHGLSDALTGYHMANEGRTKGPKVGLRIYIPNG